MAKIRQGFVSNSSSSSFICDVCGRSESGWDISPGEAEMYNCENDHTFCLDEIVKPIPEKYLDEDSPNYNEDITYNYAIPEEFCPVCTFRVCIEWDMKQYLTKKYGDDSEEAFAEIKVINNRRKKLYHSEYVFFACKKHATTVDAEFDEIKKFGTYSKFQEWLNQKR